jgi:hypothetical protein
MKSRMETASSMRLPRWPAVVIIQRAPPSPSLGIGADSSVCALDGTIRW